MQRVRRKVVRCTWAGDPHAAELHGPRSEQTRPAVNIRVYERRASGLVERCEGR